MGYNGELANYGEEMILNAIFTGDLTELPDQLYLGLATEEIDDPDTLESVFEVTDDGYKREEINFLKPVQLNEDGEEDEDGMSTVYNENLVKFGPWNEDAEADVVAAFITDSPEGVDDGGVIVYYNFKDDSRYPAINEAIKVLEESLSHKID